ncbi:MAG: hypothetical protein Q9198_007927, partial [Flavoplaca austrocitrina]
MQGGRVGEFGLTILKACRPASYRNQVNYPPQQLGTAVENEPISDEVADHPKPSKTPDVASIAGHTAARPPAKG